MVYIAPHYVKGWGPYYALEKSIWVPGTNSRPGRSKRFYIKYLGKQPHVYGMPSQTPQDGFSSDQERKIQGWEKSIVQFGRLKRQKKSVKKAEGYTDTEPQKKKRKRGRPRKTPEGRTRTGRAKPKIHRKKLTGLEKHQLRKSVIRSARDQQGIEFADQVKDSDINSLIDPQISYSANRSKIHAHYGLMDPDTWKQRQRSSKRSRGRGGWAPEIQEEEEDYAYGYSSGPALNYDELF